MGRDFGSSLCGFFHFVIAEGTVGLEERRLLVWDAVPRSGLLVWDAIPWKLGRKAAAPTSPPAP